MFKRMLLLSLFTIMSPSLWALQIDLEGLPDNYIVYEWIRNSEGPRDNNIRSQRFSRYTLQIPDEFIVRADDGPIDFLATLEEWRRETPVGYGYPYTPGGNVPRFPFTPNDGSLQPNQPGLYYISLGHVLSRAEEFPNLRFSAANGEPLVVYKSGFRQELESFKNGEPIDCTKRARLNDRDPTWTEAQCYMCNCVNEAGIKNNQGKRWVNQVVLRRVVHREFPNTICDVVLFKSRNRSTGRIGAAFSWTFGGSLMTFKGLPHPSHNSHEREMFRRQLNACVDTGIEALQAGPGPFDHYYNPDHANPRWARTAVVRERNGAHIFSRKLRLDNSNQAYLDSLMSQRGGTRVERPLYQVEEEPSEGVTVDP